MGTLLVTQICCSEPISCSLRSGRSIWLSEYAGSLVYSSCRPWPDGTECIRRLCGTTAQHRSGARGSELLDEVSHALTVPLLMLLSLCYSHCAALNAALTVPLSLCCSPLCHSPLCYSPLCHPHYAALTVPPSLCRSQCSSSGSIQGKLLVDTSRRAACNPASKSRE